MFHYTNAIQNTKGDALTGYFVKAIDPATESVVPIYADRSATPIVSVSGVDDAAEVDNDGDVSFYIAGGEYHLDIYATDAVTFVKRISYVPMVDFTVAAGNVATRSQLAAKVASADGDIFTLTEQGYAGLFRFSSADLSSAVTGDPTQQDYIAPASAPSGASGAWVRQYLRPGYTVGSGGTVTQLTSKSTNVTLNALCGQITTHSQSLADGASAGFFLLNSYIDNNDIVVVNLASAGGGAHGISSYSVRGGQCGHGSCAISVKNDSGGALAEVLVISFAIIKSVIS